MPGIDIFDISKQHQFWPAHWWACVYFLICLFYIPVKYFSCIECLREGREKKDGRLAGTLINCVLLRKQTFSFSSVTVKNRVRVRVSSRVRVRV